MKDSLEKFTEKWASIIANLISAIGLVLSAVGVWFVYLQLQQANEHKQWENYNAMNLRYYEWYSHMPKHMDESTCMPFSGVSSDIKRWARTYFDLYGEEYWLYQNNLIPKEMLEKRIAGGVKINLITYPLLVSGYEYWKRQGAFTHPDGFIEYVDQKIESLQNQNLLKDCPLHQMH